jgi:hydroxysqualene synthase
VTAVKSGARPDLPRSLAVAYAACQKIASRHYENFPVASRLLPPAMRPHVAAVYAYARVADDFADEGDRPEHEREQLLDDWLARLRRSVAEDGVPGEVAQGDRDALIFAALGDTIRRCNLQISLFEDLVSAFRQDVTVRRYATWVDLLDYCRRSANPVGRLVLGIAGVDSPVARHSSDCLCTALQLTNFWQDLERDWTRGRLYVPLEDLESCGAAPEGLDSRRITPEWRETMSQMLARTREFFKCGRTVCDLVEGRLRFELRLTWLGGQRILDRLDRAGFDVFAKRPALRLIDGPLLLWRAVNWNGRP